MTQQIHPTPFKSAAFVIACFLLLAISSCSNQSSLQLGKIPEESIRDEPLLNSERIRQKFNSYGVEVIYSDSTTRITNLFSGESHGRVMRTYAVVLYPTIVDSNLTHEHKEILAGGSIGEVFKKNGWVIKKRSIYLGEIASSMKFKDIYSMMGEIDPVNLAIYMYTFTVEKSDKYYEYATIAEVYHPHYLKVEDLRSIYSDPDSRMIRPEDLNKLITKVSMSMVRYTKLSNQLTN